MRVVRVLALLSCISKEAVLSVAISIQGRLLLTKKIR